MKNNDLSVLRAGKVLDRPLGTSDVFQTLIYIYAIWIAIFGSWKITAFGVPLFSIFFIIMSVIVCFSVFLKNFNSNIGFTIVLILLCTSLINSIMQNWNIFSSVYNAFIYIAPLALVYLPRIIEFTLDKVGRIIKLMVFIAGIISILVYFGVIETQTRINLNITILDNTIGLLGLATGLYLISIGKHNVSTVVTLLLSVVIILVGQSRARMALGVFIILLYIVFLLLAKRKGKSNNIIWILFVGLLIGYFIYSNYDEFMDYIGFSIDKFETIGSDSSSEYRINETKIHFELIKENPIFGIGCGALNNFYPTRIDYYFYAHNMITGAFAMNGIFYGMILLALLIYILINLIGNFIKDQTYENFYALLLMITVSVLSITSAGFSKPTTHIMMLVIGIVWHNFNNTKKDNLKSKYVG